MNTACHYAIVRFAPFIETGEFANVGVVIFAPDTRYFGFKLLDNNFTRLTDFFGGLEARVVKGTINSLRDELERLTAMMTEPGADNRAALWTGLIQPRETMLRFSPPRIALAENCQTKLLELYDYYVEHETTSVR
jgi:hypothetical protein